MVGSLDALVEELAVPHRAKDAYWQLLDAGDEAIGPICGGLEHRDAAVRAGCCKLLDQRADATTIRLLIPKLDDESPHVRVAAIHALACDRCKDDCPAPEAVDVLDPAIALLRDDPFKHVRAFAVELVGRFVHTAPAARDALEAAAAGDPEPMVRKKAGWYAPAGTIFERTKPR